MRPRRRRRRGPLAAHGGAAGCGDACDGWRPAAAVPTAAGGQLRMMRLCRAGSSVADGKPERVSGGRAEGCQSAHWERVRYLYTAGVLQLGLPLV